MHKQFQRNRGHFVTQKSKTVIEQSIKNVSPRRGSNSRPFPYEGNALPLCYVGFVDSIHIKLYKSRKKKYIYSLISSILPSLSSICCHRSRNHRASSIQETQAQKQLRSSTQLFYSNHLQFLSGTLSAISSLCWYCLF